MSEKVSARPPTDATRETAGTPRPPRRAEATATEQTSAEALRSDAERNRERILAAARRLLSREGLGVSLSAVAREAGVGNATLFRRFGTRERLIDAVYTDRVETHHSLVTACWNTPDPWRGFADYVQGLCARQITDPTFVEVLTMTFPAGPVEARRAEASRGALGLISRAKQAGCLRADFSHRDLTLLLLANSGVVRAGGSTASNASRRLVAQMLRAYATPDAPLTPVPDAPPATELYHAMISLVRSRPSEH